eukprot:TRINITY_DN18278_c0_g2_i1.p2 TRINITY_DN18278_c0_g2~~TRINITY_DN18278_c0_g2_i1.p2  ORF type:complete len:187 (+),score=60.11 TRINITY_DN18278_c0_g2_i1:80-640(+)
MGKGGVGKTSKPWLKKTSATPPIVGKGGSSKSGGNWVFVPSGKSVSSAVSHSSYGGGGSGKSWGKGKGKRAAPLKSDFWEKKLEGEGRQVLGNKAYSGTIFRYNLRDGWGLIAPDNVNSLPKKAKALIMEAAEKQGAAGKDDTPVIYFRKPDVNHQEGFKLDKEVAVTFSVYVDEKGAGACEVSPV